MNIYERHKDFRWNLWNIRQMKFTYLIKRLSHSMREITYTYRGNLFIEICTKMPISHRWIRWWIFMKFFEDYFQHNFSFSFPRILWSYQKVEGATMNVTEVFSVMRAVSLLIWKRWEWSSKQHQEEITYQVAFPNSRNMRPRFLTSKSNDLNNT